MLLVYKPGWCLLFLAAVGLGCVSASEDMYYDLDYADGEDSDHTCAPSSWMCLEGACIPKSWLCDGKEDCTGGEDEDSSRCHEGCEPEEFACGGGICLSKEFHCDWIADCPNAEDEKNCNETVSCRISEVRCEDDLECIPGTSICDGQPDCSDWSDEKHCNAYTCRPEEFKCGNTTECIPNSWKCDGITNCDDGLDEICSEEVLQCETFLCHDKSQCLNYPSVCNDHRDCSDGSDEAHNCSVACRQRRCSYACMLTEAGVTCACPKGFTVDPKNGLLCQDIDECEPVVNVHKREPACSQICINTRGSYHCDCSHPYSMEPDRRSCRMRHPAPILLLSGNNDIVQYNLRRKGTTLETLHTGLNNIVDMEVDSRSRRVFWIDYADKKIYYTKLTWEGMLMDKPIYVNVGLTSPQALSYNWNSGLLYILDSYQGVVVACTMEGMACAIIVEGLDDRHPGDLLVDPISRTIFWVENQSPSAIMRCDLDGRHREVFFNAHVLHMDHLQIDYPAGLMYWVDTAQGSIQRLALDTPAGNGIKFVRAFTPYGMKNPTAVAVVEEWVIWAERSSGVVMKANKWTGGDRQRLIKHHRFVTGAVVLHPAMQPEAGDNACYHSRCSKLCVESHHEHGFRCFCPPGMVLHTDGFTCKWVKTTPFLLVGSSDHITQIPTTNIGHLNMRQLSTPRLQGLRVMGVNPVTQEVIVGAQTLRGRPVLMKTSSIWRSTFTVTVIEDDADYLGSPISLAVDWAADQVFWLCEHRNTVEIIKTNGESRSQLTFEGVGGLKSIAISVDLGLLFYSVWGKHPKVVQCHMDGANCTIIHNAYYLSQPTHLLFYNQRIYWSDLKSESVSSLPYLGTEKKTEITKKSLQNFAVYNNLYFHDNTTESIHLYNMEEKTAVTDYDLPDMDIQDLVLLVPREKDLELPCAQNNGGCSDICLSLPEKKRRCLCPLGKHLATNQQTCLVTEMICPSHQILCKSSYTCLSKAKLCMQMVSCQELATPVECMHNELEPSKEEEEECPEVNVCDQFCFLTSRGPVCSCDIGYKLASDGRACTDVDECAERNGHCSQLCHNKRGSHSCSCVQGYSLISDRVTCHSTDHDGAYLIVTTSLKLIVVEMDGEREYPLLFRTFPPISFDVSLQEDWQSYHAVMQRAAKHPISVPFRTNFIWSEQRGTYIQRYAGSVSELSTMGLKVTVVRVDQVTKNVYFVTQQQETRYSVVVCDNALSQCVAVMTEQKWKPISLVLHPANRMMYWVDEQSHSLGAAYMDGQGKGAVSDDVHSMPDGLTLCAVRERLYWLDGRDPTASTIHTVKVDGSDRYMLGTFLQRKLVSLDLFDGYLYLTDRVAHSVFKISTFSSRPVLSEMRRMDSSVRHLRMVHSPPKIPNLCAMYRCSDLCLLGRKGARCTCPQHVLFAHSPEGCNHKKSQTPHHPETPEQVLPPQVPPLVFTTSPVPLPGATSTSRASATTPRRGPPVRPPHEVCWGFCLNGAFCQAVNGNPVCSCGIGFAGRRCETVVPTKGGDDDGPTEEGIGIHASNKSSAVGPPSTPPSGGLSAAAVVGIVLALLAFGALAVVGGICFRKRRAERHNYAGVEYKMENDEAFLVPGNEGSSYYKWDLGGSLLDIPTTSLDSAAFRSTANPVFNRNPVFSRHPAYHPLGSTD